MPNMKNKMNTHNQKKINPPKDNIARTCICIRKHQYPLDKKCLTSYVRYKACITPNEENSKIKIYYGVSKTTSKLIYANHKKTFNNKKNQTDTFENIISGIQLYNKKYHQKLNHF